MKVHAWSAVVCASFLGLTMTCGPADIAQGQEYRDRYRDQDHDRSRDWDLDDNNFVFGRGGVEFVSSRGVNG